MPLLYFLWYNTHMTKTQIVADYMARRYPSKLYAMRERINCIWVSMGVVEMYFTIENDKIVDIQVD